MSSTTALAVNIALAAVFIALWSGIPLWMVLRHPDEKTRAARRAVPEAQRAYERTYAARRRHAPARRTWTASPYHG
jgi:hypothetical protein